MIFKETRPKKETSIIEIWPCLLLHFNSKISWKLFSSNTSLLWEKLDFSFLKKGVMHNALCSKLFFKTTMFAAIYFFGYISLHLRKKMSL